jgi:CubicO group peptidase (beta-lactamase class C family)
MKFLKGFFKWFLIVLIVLNILILASGNTHIYKGLQHTYLKGRTGPSPTEYSIFAHHEIKAGKELPWALSKNYNKAELSTIARKELEEFKSLAFLVIKNDSILYEEYWNEGAKGSITNSFSMAKTFVSVLVGIAIGEGKIKNVDQAVGDFIPEYKIGENAKLTVKHLLTMSSGIDFDEDYVSPFAYPAKAYYGTEIRTLTMKYKLAETPGKVFKYLSGNTELLAFVLEKAIGKNISDYASEKLWMPIGASKSAFWSLDHENGVEKAYCCFNSNARDFARIGALYMHHGNWNGKQIVPEEYVKNSVIPANLVDEENKPNNRYGYSWWMLKYKGMHIYYARGILGQYVVAIPDKNILMVRLGHKRSKEKMNDHPKDVYTYIDAALDLNEKTIHPNL